MPSEIKAKNSNPNNISGDNLNQNTLDQIFPFLQKDFVWFSSLANQVNYCSANIKSVIGYSSSEIKSFNEKRLALAASEDVARIREALNEFLSDSKADCLQLYYKLTKKDSEAISVFEKIYALRDEAGELINLYGIVSDITEIKLSEEKLYETISDLQKLNEAKDKFVSRISHDLRSPFTSIIGFSEVLVNDLSLPEKDKLEYLNFILNSSRNLLHFVTQLSEIIKLQTNRLKLEPQRTNANRLIHYAISAFTAQVVDKNLEITVDVHESVHISTDERLFLLLITSLVSNAVKFSKIGDKIKISAQHFNEDFIEIIVKDQGIGMPDNNKRKIFNIDQIFFSEGTKGEKGVGLGLLLSKEIVEKHGGSLWFYSNLNDGSEFHFTIPMSKNTILILENDELQRSDFENIIKSEFTDYHVIAAGNAYDALTTLNDTIPSVLLIDHEIPLMSGLQMLQNIFKIHKSEKISVVVMVNNLTEDLKQSYNKIGVKDFLLKPISLKVLHKKLSEVISLAQ